MTSIGIRELRQRASELLRRVQAGETFEVTDRGRPVAVLAPARRRPPLDRMREIGDLDPPRSDFSDLPSPLKPRQGAELPSRVLERLRRHER